MLFELITLAGQSNAGEAERCFISIAWIVDSLESRGTAVGTHNVRFHLLVLLLYLVGAVKSDLPVCNQKRRIVIVITNSVTGSTFWNPLSAAVYLL